jgi:hypothetical protein
MGVTDPCLFFRVSPARLLDPVLFRAGRKVIDMNKLEKIIKPKEGESIHDAVMRLHGNAGIDVVLQNI